MLSKPKYGWTNITIGNWSDRASFLTDIPFNLLDAFIGSKKEYHPVSVKFDAEGWEYIIVFDYYDTYILDYGYKTSEDYLNDKEDKIKLYSFEISREDIISEFVSDLENNFDAWVMWDSCDEDELIARKVELRNKLNKLKAEFNISING